MNRAGSSGASAGTSRYQLERPGKAVPAFGHFQQYSKYFNQEPLLPVVLYPGIVDTSNSSANTERRGVCLENVVPRVPGYPGTADDVWYQ
eukprot:711525-Rhodomonas_salina.3